MLKLKPSVIIAPHFHCQCAGLVFLKQPEDKMPTPREIYSCQNCETWYTRADVEA